MERLYVEVARTMIPKKQMEVERDYIAHAAPDAKDKHRWLRATSTYKRSKMLVTQEWALRNVPALRTRTPIDANAESVAAAIEALSAVEEGDESAIAGEVDTSGYDVNAMPCPHLLVLEEHEKFKGEDGKVLEIEVRGERNAKECYFKVADVATAFEMPNINRTLLTDPGFTRDLHYTGFIQQRFISKELSANRLQKSLYLTYKGMIKVLFSSRTGIAESFQDWATDTLFTAQMGTQVSQDALAARLLKVNVKSIQDVFRCNASGKTPAIYLFEVGKATDIVPNVPTSHYGAGAPDDYIVCKYGRATDLLVRTSQHDTYYRSEFKTDIKLQCFAVIDPQHLVAAEASVRQYFRRDHAEHVDSHGKKSTELVVMHKTEIDNCKTQFQLIQKSYIGCFAELNEKITRLETERDLTEERHARQIAEASAKLCTTILEKDYTILQRDHTILQREQTIERNILEHKNALLEVRLQAYETARA